MGFDLYGNSPRAYEGKDFPIYTKYKDMDWKEKEGHADWKGNPKYEAETLKYLKPSSTNETPLKLGKQPVKFDEELLGVSASYETDGGQKEFVVYAPTTQINMLPGNGDSGQLVTSGASASSGDDPYEILEKGN